MTTQQIDAMDATMLAKVVERVDSGELVLPSPMPTPAYVRGKRFKAILDRGWELWHKPDGMSIGFIDLAQPWEKRKAKFWALGSVISGLAGAGLSFVGIDADLRTFFLALNDLGAGLASLSCLITFIATLEALGSAHSLDHQDKDLGTYRTIRAGDEQRTRYIVRYFTGPMPKEILERYQQDRHLFDACYVANNDSTLLQMNTQEVRVTKPMLIGRIEDQLFYGGNWDLANEFAFFSEADHP